MAKCPNCKENWFWDWEQDIYRYTDGSDVEILNFVKAKSDEPKIEIYVFKCNCGAVNSIMFLDLNSGMFVRCIEAWDIINWEKDGHSWDNKCLDCKTINCLTEN